MKHHSIKCWPEFFEALHDGRKTFELRKNDRDYRVGDTLEIREWEPEESVFTGRTFDARVTYVAQGPKFGLEAGWCCLGLVALNFRHKGKDPTP